MYTEIKSIFLCNKPPTYKWAEQYKTHDFRTLVNFINTKGHNVHFCTNHNVQISGGGNLKNKGLIWWFHMACKDKMYLEQHKEKEAHQIQSN